MGRDRSAHEVGWVSVLASESRTRIVLAGELDETLTGDLTEAVELAVHRGLPVDIDARNTTFMDSSTVATLARLAARLPGRPRLIEPPEILLFLLDVTDLGQILDIVEVDPGFVGTPLRGEDRAADPAPA
ncbi:STAS domain-containing protein [Georgenia sp. AZ-5]|uniref:STAS domain-containing protein n=1 Tax=Georgenia sp. AZ-5 TaxID=3367526 RepID=UPI0037542159